MGDTMLHRSSSRFFPLLFLVACAAPAKVEAPPQPAPTIRAPAPREPEPPQGARLGELLNAPPEDASAASPAQTTSAWANAAPDQARGPVAPSAADTLAIAREVCESPSVARGKAGFKCTTCPSYTEFAGQAHDMDLALFPGRFSGPGREEVFVAMKGGCESGASSGQSYGGRALVRKTPSGWQRSSYAAGALGECTSILSRAGRSRLFCHLRAGHMGVYRETLSLVGFDEAEEQNTLILELYEHDVAYLRRSSKEPLPVLALQRHSLIGKERYEAGDDRALSIEVSVRSSVDCVGGCPGVDRSSFDTALRYVFDGTAFQLALESRAAFARLEPRNHE